MNLCPWLVGTVSLVVPCFVLANDITNNSLQIFAGYSDTAKTNVDVDILYVVPPESFHEPVDGHSTSVGLRYLHNFDDPSTLAFGMELSSFSASSSNVELDIVPMTILVFYSFNQGSLSPYAGIGYSLAFIETRIDADATLGLGIDEQTFAPGWELRAGVSRLLSARYELFFEYRYSMLKMRFESESIAVPPYWPSQVTQRINADINTHHLLLGLSYRY